jgi:hypothetical protein
VNELLSLLHKSEDCEWMEADDGKQGEMNTIVQALSELEGRERWRRADQLEIGSLIVVDEMGRIEPIVAIDTIFLNETLFNLLVEHDRWFITSAGVTHS